MSSTFIGSTRAVDPSTLVTSDPNSTTFVLFPDLPSELQLKIWEEAMPGPRVVKIGHRPGYGKFSSDSSFPLRQESPTIPTPLFHTCMSSRAIVLSKIKPSFQIESAQPIYCDFKKDTILLTMSGVFIRKMFMDVEDIARIRFLAITDIAFVFFADYEFGFDLRDFKALRSALFAKPHSLISGFGAPRPGIPTPPAPQSNSKLTMHKRDWRFVENMGEEVILEEDGTQLPRCSLITEAEMEALEHQEQHWQ